MEKRMFWKGPVFYNTQHFSSSVGIPLKSWFSKFRSDVRVVTFTAILRVWTRPTGLKHP